MSDESSFPDALIPICVIEDEESVGLSIRFPNSMQDLASLSASEIDQFSSNRTNGYVPLIRDNTNLVSSADHSQGRNQQVSEILGGAAILNDSYYENALHNESYFKQAPSTSQPVRHADFKKDYKDLEIMIRAKSSFEKIDEMPNRRCSEVTKAVLRAWEGLRSLCRLFIFNSWFELFILIIILMNIVILALEDPLADEQNPTLQAFDTFFLYIYTIEAALKIIGMGFLFEKGAYLRESWNVLDFIIVLTFWVERVAQEGVNLRSLRMLRVLRPLRSISNIEGLRALILALISSIKPLLFSIIVFLFFLCLFAIAGLQLWMGLFKNRCIQVHNGLIGDDSMICGNYGCPDTHSCTSILDNPNFGITNFDNIFFAFLAVFQCVTLEGWTYIMISAQKAFSDYAVFYFVPLVFIGAFLILNFILAVIKYHFTKAMDIERVTKKDKRKYEDKELDDHLIKGPKIEHNRDLKFKTIQTQLMPSNTIVRPVELSYFSNNSASLEEIPQTNTLTIRKEKGADVLKEVSSFQSEESEEDIPPHYKTFAIARTITMKTFKKNDEYKKLHTQKNFLSQIAMHGGSLKIKKDLAVRKAEDYENFVYSVNENVQTFSNSHFDVLPEISRTLETAGKYSFSYSEEEYQLWCKKKCDINLGRYHHYGQYFNIFNKLSLKIPRTSAFFAVAVSGYSTVLETLEYDKAGEIKGKWSGQTVADCVSGQDQQIQSLSTMTFRLWRKGCLGTYEKLKRPVSILVHHKAFSHTLTIAVALNTIVLAMDHYGIDEDMDTTLLFFNITFTAVFTIEMILKLIGLGLVEYLRDAMNYLDATVVIVSLVEIVFLSQNSALTAFRTVRVFRTFRVLRVLRVARLFRYINSMAEIVIVLSKTIYQFMYLALLLVLFIIVFALLGMQIFGGQFGFPEGTPRANFDSFHSAFVTVFQVLSMEDWQSVLYDAMRSPVGYASALYFIAWIFLGNYVILNLFLAIVLDSFDQYVEDPTEETNTIDEIANVRRRSSIFNANLMRSRKKKEEFHIKRFMEEQQARETEKELDSLRKSKSPIKQLPFQNIHCKRSFFIFSKKNKLRIFCYNLTISSKFEQAILVIIFLSSIKLVIDTYMLEEPDDSEKVEILSYFDLIFTIIFGLEFLIKAISQGFAIEKGAYLREVWNQLDFSIVVLSVIELSIRSLDLPFIKALRLLRTLRPLRFISHNLSMKLVVTALLESLFAIFNVVIVLFIVWLMFAILGVSLFSGKLYTCEEPLIDNQTECELYGQDWVNADSNYDNVIEAMLSLFIISSLEGWPKLMYAGIDAREEGKAPVKDYNPPAAYYFIAFIFVGSFFFVNLFIGVVFMQFNQAKKNEANHIVLNERQRRWLEVQKLVLKSKPHFDSSKDPQSKCRLYLHKLSKHVAFEIFILCCIMLNMLQMAMAYAEASTDYLNALEALNLCFTLIFIMEAMIKLVGLTPKGYFSNNWNRFDFLVVVASLLDLSLMYTLDSEQSLLTTAPQLARVIRVLRVSRLIRVFKSLKPLQDLVMVMAVSLPAILNVLSLLVLIFFIYAILGAFLFYQVQSGEVIDEFTNFQNFGMGMISLLRVSTGESWNMIMFDIARREGSVIAGVYFCSFIVITTFIMLNLFVMVIVQSYQDYKKNPKNTLQMFTAGLKQFKAVWADYSAKYRGLRMNFRELPAFAYDLGASDDKLGVPGDLPHTKVVKLLSTMDIHIEEDGFVYYNDLLYSFMKRRHHHFRETKNKGLALDIISNAKKETAKKLKKLRERAIDHFKKTRSIDIYSKAKHEFFYASILCKTVFKAWKRRVQAKKLRSNDSSNLTPQSCAFPGCNSINDEESYS